MAKTVLSTLKAFVDSVLFKRTMLCIGAVKSHVTRPGHVTALKTEIVIRGATVTDFNTIPADIRAMNLS